MKQTAVEFLNERFTYIKWMRDRDEISSETGLKWYNEALEKAKQMEKEQIIDAWQQERMYSEEDMEKAFTNGLNRSFDSDFDRWFEQFKKK